ncbi:MAG TPA: hypothetical protein VFW65_34310 [Pseudonocardiaceae bacterium]|nr:hypothetical protein [Pseudonocardiaceae bacterium]
MIAGLRSTGGWLYRISDRALYAVLAIGVLTSPFYRFEYLRATLLGTAVVPASAALAVLALGLCVAWRSLLRRDFAWAEPAWLTWTDSGDGRIHLIGRRLWTGWIVRFAAVGYLAAVSVLVLGETGWLAAGCALFSGVALLAVVVARRAPGRAEPWLEYAVIAATVVLAGTAAVTSVGSLPLWVLAGLAVVSAVVLAFGSGRPRRPAVAVSAGRADLVRGYAERTVRRVMVSFGDALALLPPPGRLPFPRLLGGRAVVARFVLAGVLSRARVGLLAVLCVVVIVVAHQVFPVVSPVWLVGVGMYFAGVPFAAGLASLWAVPGLRRWLGCADITLRLATAVVVAAIALAVVGLVAAFAVPVPVAVWLAVPLAVGAVVRTVTRKPLDFANVGVAATPQGYLLPVGLLAQLVHGPDLLVIGLLIVASGLLVAALAPAAVALAAYGVAR